MRDRRSSAACLLLLVGSLSVHVRTAEAQWIPDGVALCTAPQDQSLLRCVSDGTHGALVYFRSSVGPDHQPLAQRVNSEGAIPVGWPACGVALSTTFGSIFTGSAISDGAGGAILAWSDRRVSVDRTYVQRITDSGEIAAGWPADPVPVVANNDDQRNVHLATDGANGAIVAWESAQLRVYAVRITSSGGIASGWPSTGRLVSLPAPNAGSVSLCEDGAGGAYVAWSDRRDYASTGMDIYCQRLAADGSTASGWPVGGIPLCVAPGSQGWGGLPNPITASDGLGGALVLWPDQRDRLNASEYDLYLARVDPAGGTSLGWMTNGVPVCVTPGLPLPLGEGAALCADGSGGAYVAWSDGRLSAPHVYAQRIGSDGSAGPGWPPNGLLICGQQSSCPVLVPDGAGGAIVAWSDNRALGYGARIYATRLAPGGLDPGWPTDGLAICTAGQSDNPRIATDGAGGAIIAWANNRPAGDYNVYAQHVTGSGGIVVAPVYQGTPPTAFTLRSPAPNPTSAETTIRFSLPRGEIVSVEVLTVSGRRIRQLARATSFGAGLQTMRWDGTDDGGAPVPSGVYYARVSAGGETASSPVTLIR